MDYQGYYSILQYSPCPEREEGINCGIFFVVPIQNYINIMTIDNSLRLLSLFNEPEGAPKLRAMIRSIKKTVLENKNSLLEDGSYHYLPVKSFEDFRFCPFRNCTIPTGETPESTHQQLFFNLIDSSEDSTLVESIKTLLNHVKEDLFQTEKKVNNPGNIVTFLRAVELLAAADEVRDILED